MSDWTAGYVADIGYTFGYYTELNPLRVKLAFLNAGLVPPEMGTACELGFGQGMSANLHAAASVVQWHGTDFNPSQAAFAQELASSCGSGAQLYDEAFDQFCSRPDLPEFDYIGLHGIWSWISDENRAVIVDFIRRKLKVGGVVYISYNTQPGWAAMVPMRDLLTEHAEVMGADGAGIVSRIDSALAFVDQLLAANPAYARAVVYDFCESRAGKHASEFLKGWSGTLLVDDFAGYKQLIGEQITEAGCWAHARRKFFELHTANQSQIAVQALEQIGQLYEIEREVQNAPADERLRIRQQQSRPVVDKPFTQNPAHPLSGRLFQTADPWP